MDKEDLEVLLDAREARIVELEAENKQLKARVIGNPARNLPPPAPIATTNMEFWGLMKEEQEKLVSKEPIFRDLVIPDRTEPPIKCTNCEE